MSEAPANQGDAGGDQSKSGPDCYVSSLQRSDVPPVARALQSILPLGTSHAQLTAFFADRVALSTVRMWRRGQRKPPQWALDILRAHIDQLAQCVTNVAPSDKTRTGTEALRRYRLERRALNNQR